MGKDRGKDKLAKLAAGISAIIILGWAIFWSTQVISVIELLELAYG
ncbi:MAG: hypothetical protein WD002_12885 [Pseudomonadales bacterium]